MAYAQEKFLLPTAGRVEGIPAELTFRNMSTKEEKLLLGSSDSIFDDVIKGCVVEDNFDFDMLTSADKFFCLIKIRIISYGPIYNYKYKCPYCGQVREYETNLDDLEVYYLDEDFKEPYDVFSLPLTKDEIALRLPRLKDVKENRRKVKVYSKKFPEAKGDQSLIYGMMSNIQTVNGKVMQGSEFTRYIENLPVRDSNYIRNRINRLKLGIDSDIFEICKNPACGEEVEISLNIGAEFFYSNEGR